MVRPLLTDCSIVVNLSSIRIKSAESFVTSVPAIPIAIPISAARNAGASLTPSPVIATICPCFCNCLTMRCLCSGDTRAQIFVWFTRLYNSSSDIFSISIPLITVASTVSTIPNSKAIALAVFSWSPVIITTSTFAFFNVLTDSFTSSRAGSIIPATPVIINCFSNSSTDPFIASCSVISL